MSLYKELNEVEIDLEQYEEASLSSFEKKRWEKRIIKKLRSQTPNHKKKYVAVTIASILAIGISISTGLVSVANMPFVGGMIEDYIGNNEVADYSTYKTAIGETAENKYGKMTLNEVMVDGGRLIMSSTFEPTEGVKFNFRMHPMPQVKINGKNLTTISGGESVEVNDSMFTIYNDIELSDLPLGEKIKFHIAYDHLDLEKPIDNPWIFDIEIPTEKLAKSSETILLEKNIELENGGVIRLEKMIISPVSTVLYYDWPNDADHIAFKLVSESGKEILPNSMAITDEGLSSNRYDAINLKSEKYYLVPFEESKNPHAKDPGKVPDQSILLNP